MRLALLVFVAAFDLAAQSRFARIGDVAPPLKMGAVVQGSLKGYTPGRGAVIEFWAASCAPCVASLPHLNELAQQFKNEPIDFISIDTFEPVEVVQRFLKEHAMEGTVATDDQFATSSAYGIEATPTSILVSTDGRVVQVCHPKQVTASVIERLLAGEPIDLPPLASGLLTSAVPKRRTLAAGSRMLPDDSSLVRIAVVPTTNAGGLIAASDQVESTGSPLRDLLAYAYKVPTLRVEVPEILANERYEVQAWVPSDSIAELGPLLQSAIRSAAGISIRKESRMIDGLILNGFPGRLTAVPETKLFTSNCEKGVMEGDGVEVEVIRACIEQRVGRPVLIQQGTAGRFSFSLRWDPAQPGAFERELREQLGMQLVPTRAPVEYLIVEPRMATQF